MKMVFTACMEFRKVAVINSDQSIPDSKTLKECVDLTVCPKEEGASCIVMTCLRVQFCPTC